MVYTLFSDGHLTVFDILPDIMNIQLFAGNDFVQVAIEAPPLDMGLEHVFDIKVCTATKDPNCTNAEIPRRDWITVRHR